MSVPNFKIPKAIHLYYSEGIKDLDFKKIKEFTIKNFGSLEFNLIRLKKEAAQTKGLFFDFFNTQKVFQKIKYSRAKNSCHIFLTERLFATIGEDNRPHIRASIYGFPSVISTSGIVEGPAKPKEFYFYKQRYIRLGIWNLQEDKLKKKFKGRFIDYQDKRLTEVIKGYIAQGLFFYITGEPFCKNKNCRLFNAHWQEDLLYAQVKSGNFCNRHREILQKIRTGSK